ncbi:TonB-dependent siderophore receptor [Negadavirga shengliensis]|uniref:TonB-dependent siderophore receptor n=1 Tax=Negadavirga shengliensis TaxID=1389218 RepID=A0ABV9SZF2_9BACT
MKKRYLLFLFCALLTAGASMGQNEIITIKGKIKDITDQSVAGATIQIAGTTHGTASDREGNFSLDFSKPGNYELIISFVGFETQKLSINVASGQKSLIEVTLKEDISQLQFVEIIGRKEDSYRNTTSFVGSKSQTQLKDLPQSVSYVTKEVIMDQGLMRSGETVRNFSGVNQFTFYDDITIRGFRVNGGSNTQLVNGMRTTSGFWKQPLINFLERVEVLKGPSSALFGNASPGGVVNRVTKKPLDSPYNSVSFSMGSFNTFRTLADFTGPANESKTLLYRLNLGYEDAHGFRDLQFDKNIVIAPSLSFLPSDKTRVNLDFVFNNSNSRLDRGQSAFEDDLYSTPVSLSLNTANDYLKEQTYTMTASLTHRFSSRLNLNMSYMKTGYSEDLTEHRSSNVYAIDGTGATLPNMVARQIFIRKRSRFVDNLTTYFNYNMETGSIKHKWVFGYDYAREMLPPGGSQLTATGYRNAANTGVINTFDPNRPELYLLDNNGNPVPNVPHFDLTDPVGSQRMQDMSKYFYATRGFDPTLYQLNGLYVQDQLQLGKFQAMLGLRYENYTDFENYRKDGEQKVNQYALLPRLGLVYTVTPAINLYGTYVEGYNPQTAAVIANPNAGGPFDPLISDMVEFGAKSEWFNKNLEVTTALYRIRQKNTLYSVVGEQDLLEQIGEEVAQGFEVDVVGRILTNWSILASYAFNEASITESPHEQELGIQKPNAPKHQGNFWTKYDFIRGELDGLGFGFGTNFVSARNVSLSDTQTLPGYMVMNAAVYYTSGNMRLQLNMNNLADQQHWVGGYDYLRLFPGAPRNFLGTLTYTF